MPANQLKLPSLIIHCDWGSTPDKRWMATAKLESGKYTAFAPQLVGELSTLLERHLIPGSNSGPTLVGFDFPIGLPQAFAQKARIHQFAEELPQLGSGLWKDFFLPADDIEDVLICRPFYPQTQGKKGEKTQLPFLQKLGVHSANDLRRLCERQTDSRGNACPLFWLTGGNQVGKSAIIGWKDVIIPALAGETTEATKLWPFDGTLCSLLGSASVVFAETYPTQYHRLIFKRPFTGKQRRKNRLAVRECFTQRAKKWNLSLDKKLKDEIELGFPVRDKNGKIKEITLDKKDSGDDAFDAAVGLFGMIDAVQKWGPHLEPTDTTIQNIEGWILGQPIS